MKKIIMIGLMAAVLVNLASAFTKLNPNSKADVAGGEAYPYLSTAQEFNKNINSCIVIYSPHTLITNWDESIETAKSNVEKSGGKVLMDTRCPFIDYFDEDNYKNEAVGWILKIAKQTLVDGSYAGYLVGYVRVVFNVEGGDAQHPYQMIILSSFASCVSHIILTQL